MTELRKRAVALGEAMIEMAPIGDGLYRRGFAGDTFNTVWHMAQALGDQATVGYVSRIGSDRISDSFVAMLEGDGLDASGIARDTDRGMGLYMIDLDGVERSFHYWRSQSAARRLADDPEWLSQALGKADLIHVSGITLAILSEEGRRTVFSVLKEARQGGALVSFDPNIRPALWESPEAMRQTIQAAMTCCDIALPSFDDERTHWGDSSPSATIDRFLSAGIPEVVVKDGSGDIRFHAPDGEGVVETPSVSWIRDTTGAGDAFNAGYLAARLVDLSPRQAVAQGQAMSAVVLQHPGARIPKDLVPSISTSTG